ncbi:tripartite tricarboxylate transporter substrate binding protein [Candidimonas humi]|uniref:Bug family tripartite tricarboxylate transporter substrate binding protein n=1 Tax=Candidimonas humi TaxID=683355 RepID=A0ABV8P0X5_9BURK|nr:tripartite tricarboxylate transporter substrate binding protein [Candidimonas humi]MBV6306191.1 tripartite tricarboxylate transporter substrate binding protein [Candidimonas humi]
MRKILMAALACLAFSAHAQDYSNYPAHPIRFIIISSAGSGGDVLSRLLISKMAPILKGNMVPYNKPGAGGSIATDMVAKAAPDGYTIGIGGATTHVLLPASNPHLSYDPVKDFEPIGQVGTASILLLATKDFPANNLKELVALAKKSPETLQYASWGNASTGNFCGELLKLARGIKMTHIPYKSVAQIQNDMLGGFVKLGFVDMASGTPLVKSGRLKALASCTSPSPSLPEVPSYEKEGITFSGQHMGALRWALYAPAGTPKPIVAKLSAALKQTVEMPDVKAKLLAWGITPAFVGGDELQKSTIADIAAWKKVAKAANIVSSF